MSLLLLLGGGGEAAPSPSAGVTFPALGIRVIFEVSETAPFATPVWHDFSKYLHGSSPIAVKRGRSHQFDDVQAGTLNLKLDATSGDLDPKNLASPHIDCLKVRRRCRLRIIHNDITYPVFDGFSHGFPRSYSRPNLYGVIPFTATDGFRILNNAAPTVGLFRLGDPVYGRLGVGRLGGGTTAEQLSGSLINALLDALGWPSTLRNIDPGRVMVAGSDITGKGLAAMQAAATAEGGEFFMSRDGKATLRNRLAKYLDSRSTTPQVTFRPKRRVPHDPTYTEPFDVANDDTRIVNEARYTGASGLPQIVRDEPSISEYGINDRAVTLAASGDTDVKSLAVLTVADNAEPVDRYEQLKVNAHPVREANIAAVLGRELFDLIAVEIHSTWGADAETVHAVVEGIDLTIGSASMTAAFQLGAYHPHSFFTLGHPTLGQLGGVGVLAP